jgi:hypothetical protein
MIYFSDEFLEEMGYRQEGNVLIVDGEKYIIKRAIDSKDKRGYMVVKSTK